MLIVGQAASVEIINQPERGPAPRLRRTQRLHDQLCVIPALLRLMGHACTRP